MSDQNAPAQARIFKEPKVVNPKVEVAFSIYESKTIANGVDPEIVESRRLGPLERTLLEIFEAADEDGLGILSPDHLLQAMQSEMLNLNLTNDEIIRLQQLIGEQDVAYREFLPSFRKAFVNLFRERLQNSERTQEGGGLWHTMCTPTEGWVYLDKGTGVATYDIPTELTIDLEGDPMTEAVKYNLQQETISLDQLKIELTIGVLAFGFSPSDVVTIIETAATIATTTITTTPTSTPTSSSLPTTSAKEIVNPSATDTSTTMTPTTAVATTPTTLKSPPTTSPSTSSTPTTMPSTSTSSGAIINPSATSTAIAIDATAPTTTTTPTTPTTTAAATPTTTTTTTPPHNEDGVVVVVDGFASKLATVVQLLYPNRTPTAQDWCYVNAGPRFGMLWLNKRTRSYDRNVPEDVLVILKRAASDGQVRGGVNPMLVAVKEVARKEESKLRTEIRVAKTSLTELEAQGRESENLHNAVGQTQHSLNNCFASLSELQTTFDVVTNYNETGERDVAHLHALKQQLEETLRSVMADLKMVGDGVEYEKKTQMRESLEVGQQLAALETEVSEHENEIETLRKQQKQSKLKMASNSSELETMATMKSKYEILQKDYIKIRSQCEDRAFRVKEVRAQLMDTASKNKILLKKVERYDQLKTDSQNSAEKHATAQEFLFAKTKLLRQKEAEIQKLQIQIAALNGMDETRTKLVDDIITRHHPNNNNLTENNAKTNHSNNTTTNTNNKQRSVLPKIEQRNHTFKTTRNAPLSAPPTTTTTSRSKRTYNSTTLVKPPPSRTPSRSPRSPHKHSMHNHNNNNNTTTTNNNNNNSNTTNTHSNNGKRQHHTNNTNNNHHNHQKTSNTTTTTTTNQPHRNNNNLNHTNHHHHNNNTSITNNTNNNNSNNNNNNNNNHVLPTPLKRYSPKSVSKSKTVVVGDRVIVRAKQKAATPISGVVHFIRPTTPPPPTTTSPSSSSSSVVIGVLLDEPVGDTDGTLLGKRYFEAPRKHGIFVSASEILSVQSVKSPPPHRSLESITKLPALGVATTNTVHN